MANPLTLSPKLDGIPTELRQEPRWVVWRSEPKAGQAKPKKMPYDPKSGAPASSTDPTTWAPYEQAVNRYESGDYSGVGFMLGEGWAGVDIDDCLDPVRDTYSSLAQEIVNALASYTETSPSGTGVKIFVRGRLPEHPWCKNVKLSLEMYDQGRFFTVTGRRREGAAVTVEERTDVLAQLQEKYRRADRERTDFTPGESVLSDEVLLQKARNAANGEKYRKLFDEGDISDHENDHSSADFALMQMLAFWSNRDPEQMETLFSESALGQRDKWSDRADYRERTIAKAIAACKDVYTPGTDPAAALALLTPIGPGMSALHLTIEDPFNKNPEELDAASLGLKKPDPARWFIGSAVDGGLPGGKIALMAGHGGCGKSTLALQMAASIVTGNDCTGGLFRFHERGPCLYINAEDEEGDLQERLYHMRQRFPGLNPAGLTIVRGAGDYRFIQKDRGGNLRPTAQFEKALDLARRVQPVAIFIDPAAQFLGGADEIANGDVTYFAALLRVLQSESGAKSVFTSAHVNKGSQTALDTAAKIDNALSPAAVRGGTGLVDAHRWVLTMTAVPPKLNAKFGATEKVSLAAWRIAKSNYSATTTTHLLQRGAGGILEPYAGEFKMTEIDHIEAFIDANPGRYTQRTILDVLPGHMGISKASCGKLVKEALDRGVLIEEAGRNGAGRATQYLFTWAQIDL